MAAGRIEVGMVLVGGAIALAGCGSSRATRAAAPSPRARTVPLWGPAGGFDLRQHTHGTAGETADLDVSPRGDWIAFTWTEYTRRPKIFMQRTDRPEVVQKTFGDGHDDIDPRFSPDGERLAFASNRDGDFNIYLIDAWRSGGAVQITFEPSEDVHPTFSPDGTRIAYAARGSDGVWMIWIRDLRTQQATRLGPGMEPEWSPAGDRIAFQLASGREPGWFGIWVVDVEGGNRAEVIASSRFAAVNASWSPDGRSLAFERIAPQGEGSRRQAWVVDLDTGTRIRLAEAEADDADPAWGLDGRIYFASNRDGSWNVWSLNPTLADRPVPAVAAEQGPGGGRP